MRWLDEELNTLRWKDEIEEAGEKFRWKDELPVNIPGKSDATTKEIFASLLSNTEPDTQKTAITRSLPEKILRGFTLATEGAKKGITLGLSEKAENLADYLVGKVTGKPPASPRITAETKAERIAEGTGEFAGAIVPIGTLFKGAKFMPTPNLPGLGGKVAQGAIRGGAAGSVYEGGKAAIEGNSLPDVAKAAGEGALFWGGVEAGLPVLGAGAKAVIERLPKRAPRNIPAETMDAPAEVEEIATTPQQKPLNVPGKGEKLESGEKVRSLGVSGVEAEFTSPEVKQGLIDEMIPGGRGVYDPITNEETLNIARQLIEEDVDAVTRRILSAEPANATDNTAGLLLVKQANDAGDYGKAVDLVEALAGKATNQGQAIQALSMWGRLTPEGMLKYSQKVIDRANAQNKRMAGRGNRFKMTDETAESIVTFMQEAEGLEGRAKEVKIAQALDVIAAQVPAPILRKIGTLHTMAQLLNPKTAIRNLVGNTGFQVWENVSDVIGTGLDVATSAFTGQRSKVLPSLVTQGKGMKKGFKLGLEDALLGIDTSAQATKFDLPQGRTFRKGPLAGLEKAMNIELRATDRAFYQGAYDESLRQQMAAAKIGKRPPAPTEAMKEIAHHDGLYRTFQDDNALSAFFQGFKRLLNDPAYTMGFAKDRPMREFGAGDFIIKYPRTPANLLARGLEYSPAGLLKTLMEASRPLMGREFNQKAFVESFSRAITGTTSGVGLGAALHRLGIITGGPDEDWDVAALERQAGFGEYRLNASGLKRFVKTFDPEQAKIRPGDTTISYDWFEPQAIPLAVGADIDANKGQAKGIAGTLINAFTTGINAFADQPVVQGLETLFGQEEPADAIPAVLKGIPASFAPSLFNQIKQLVDDQRRITYDPSITQETLNRAIYRTPGLAGSLPKGYGTLGQEQSIYQEGSKLTDNNIFNVFFNPAFVNKYAPTPEAQMVLDIYKNTGETDQVPHVIKKYFNIPGGEKITLTAEEYSQMQRQVGELTQQGFARIPADISDEEKIKRMVSVMTDTGREARITVLEQRGIPVPESWLPKPGGAKYLLKAIEDGDSQAIETATMAYCAKNGKSAYDLYKYAHDAGYLDENGKPNPTLQRGLELVWENQGKKQASSAAYSFLLDACAEGNEEEALRWAGVIKGMGKGWKNVEGSIRARAVVDKRNTKTPTLEEIYQGGYKIDPLTVQRALWAMNQ